MNLIEDLMERSPASRLGIVAVDGEGKRRDWHFGELIACSAGLSGAFAARGRSASARSACWASSPTACRR